MADKTNGIDPTRRTPSDFKPKSIAQKVAVERLVKIGAFKRPPSNDGPHWREMTAFLHSFDGTRHEKFVWPIFFDWSRPKTIDLPRIEEATRQEGLSPLIGPVDLHVMVEYIARETTKEVRRQLKLNGIDDPFAPTSPPVVTGPLKTEGAVSQGVFAYKGKRAENIPPAPWRLLEFMEGRIESDTEEAYRYAIKDHAKESTSSAIKSLLSKANAALAEVTYPKNLSKVRGLEKLIWS